MKTILNNFISLFTFKFKSNNKNNFELKVGDYIRISERNLHLWGVCAYAGYCGFVKQIWDDGSFYLDNGTSILVIPLHYRKGVWIYHNGTELFYNGKK